MFESTYFQYHLPTSIIAVCSMSYWHIVLSWVFVTLLHSSLKHAKVFLEMCILSKVGKRHGTYRKKWHKDAQYDVNSTKEKIVPLAH